MTANDYKNPLTLAIQNLAKDRMFVVCMDSRNILEIKLDEEGNPEPGRSLIQRVDRIAYMELI